MSIAGAWDGAGVGEGDMVGVALQLSAFSEFGDLFEMTTTLLHSPLLYGVCALICGII